MNRYRRGSVGILAALTLAIALNSCAAVNADSSSPSTGAVTATTGHHDPEPVDEPGEPALPITVDSADGTSVTVKSVARVIAIDRSGTLGQTVFGLGLGDRLVARDIATDFPSVRQLPVVTPGGHQVNAEAILALRPTVVLTDSSIGPRAALQQLRDAGIAVVHLPPERTIATVPTLITTVGTALGVPQAGERLAARTVARISAASRAAAGHARGERIAFLYLRGTSVAMISGRGAGTDEIIAALGAVDAGVQSGLTQAFTPITAEALITARPDVLLLMSKGLDSVGGVDGLLKVPGVAQTPAGRTRRVVVMDDTELLSFGPGTGDVIAALDTALRSGAG